MQIISFFPTLSTKMPHLVPNEYESSQINMFATFCKPVSQVSVRTPPPTTKENSSGRCRSKGPLGVVSAAHPNTKELHAPGRESKSIQREKPGSDPCSSARALALLPEAAADPGWSHYWKWA